MAEYELPKRRWATMVTIAFIVLIAAAIAALFFFAPKAETQSAAEPAPVATQPVEQEAPAEPAPAPVATQAPEPSQSPTSSIPEPKYTRDDLNILGKSIWDAFGEDVVLVNSGVQYPDANFNTKVIRPFDPSAALGDEKPLNIEGSNWVIRVTETDAKNGTVWSIIT